MGHFRNIVLTDIWATCNKLQAALFRCSNLDLRKILRDLDPNAKCGVGLISRERFRTALLGPLRNYVSLSEQEVEDLAEYFSMADERIHYGQLCDVIYGNEASGPSPSQPDLVSGLEWDDPLRVNRISDCESRRLCQLIVKIATAVKLRDVCLRGCFQDYELISRDVGVTSLDHFARALHRCGLTITDEDHRLLVKRFQRDRYTINHIAFCKAVDDAVTYLDQSGLEQMGEEVNRLYPNRLIDAQLVKLHRPEIGRFNIDNVLDVPPISFHGILEVQRKDDSLHRLMRRIQRHVYSNGIRCAQFMECADPLRTGRVSVDHFRRALDQIGISGLHRLPLNEREIQEVIELYRDPNDLEAVCWQTFDNDVNLAFTLKGLEQLPDQLVECPPLEVMELPRQGAPDWEQIPEKKRDLCENTVAEIRATVSKRGLDLMPLFRAFDITSSGHVTRSCMRRVLLGCHRFDARALWSLEDRYLDQRGFNYRMFLSEVVPQTIEEPLFKQYWLEKKTLNEKELFVDNPKDCEKDLPLVLSKIKSAVVSRGVNVIEFMRDYDRSNEGCVSLKNFRRALEICNLGLTNTEHKTVSDAFASPRREGYVDHVRFSRCCEEALYQLGLERNPMIVPLQFVPGSRGCKGSPMLNRDQRRLARHALELLARKPDRVLNYLSVFQDFDPARCGSVSEQQFARVLSVRDTLTLLTPEELNLVMRCFHVDRGFRQEVDYRAFLQCLDITNATLPHYPF